MEKAIKDTDTSNALSESTSSESTQNMTQSTPITGGVPVGNSDDLMKGDKLSTKQQSWIAKTDEGLQQDNRVRPWADTVGNMVSSRDPLAYQRHDADVEKDLMLRDETECPRLAASVSFAG